MDASTEKKKEKDKAKIKAEAIKVEIFGDLLKFSKKNPREILPLKKYDSLAMHLIALSRGERILVYKFLCGLALSAHARRTNDSAQRREIFDVKNRLFLSVANNMEVRRVLNFRFCVSKRFKVLKYCSECEERNRNESREPRAWTFCPKCEVDRTYFNVLSMFHKFKGGGASMYLGKEFMPKIENLKPVKHVNIDDLPEQLSFERFRFTPHNLISLDLTSLLEAARKLIPLQEKIVVEEPPPGGTSARRPLTAGPSAGRGAPRKPGPSTSLGKPGYSSQTPRSATDTSLRPAKTSPAQE